MTETQEFTDPTKLTYEQARDELTAIVAQLEEGASSLDQSLTLWERGEVLAKLCTAFLDSAQSRLDANTESLQTKAAGTAQAAGEQDQPAGQPSQTEEPENTARRTKKKGTEPADPPW